MGSKDFPLVGEYDFAIRGTVNSAKAPQRWGKGRKRCSKGKSCSATCIARYKVCIIELGTRLSADLTNSRNLLKVPKKGAIQSVSAHPALAKDYSNAAISAALSKMEKLDPDAARRVGILRELLSPGRKTQVMFIDWKDNEGNKKLFMSKVRNFFEDAEVTFNEKIAKKTWGGVAWRNGTVMVRTSPGFNPKVEAIRNKIRAELNKPKTGENRPYAIGSGSTGEGNNSLRTLVHELGHIAHFTTKSMPFSKKFSKYADTNHEEAFAEAFVVYMFNGPQFKSKLPTVYNEVETILKKGGLI